MRLLKRIVIMSLCVFALTGCTQSSLTSGDILMETQDNQMIAPDGSAVEEDVVVEKNTENRPMDEFEYDWEQVEADCKDMFMDESFYPLTYSMEYAVDVEALTVELEWILKNGVTEEEALEYATELVKRFNDIMAVQKSMYEASTYNTFGSVWNTFALAVKITTEDGTVMADKSYAAGDVIDLPLPEYSGNGPQATVETESPVKPGA